MMESLKRKYLEWQVLAKHYWYVQQLKMGWSKDTAPQEIEDGLDDGLPMPPAYLVYLVGGNTKINPFLHGGMRVANGIRDILAKNNIAIESLRAILDFGCGCGRVVRRWHDLKGPRIYGTDYNRNPIRWCRANLRFAQFDTNRLAPPMQFPDQTFDFIYAFSVFTHFTPDLQFHWIKELSRLLMPGGYLLMTTHGDSFKNALGQYHEDIFASGELVVLSEFAAGTNLTAAYHPQKFVCEKLAPSAGFQVVDFAPQAVDQDFWLLKKISS
jgi:SAM-dependent methyltransferase